MDSLSLSTASAAWALASAIAVVAIGVVSLMGGKSRARGALPFGLFGITWGLQITFGNLTSLTSSEGLASVLYLLALASLLVTPFFLVEFAASQDQRGDRRPLWRVLKALSTASAALAALLLLLEPGLLYDGVTSVGGRVLPNWGPLYIPLVIVPHFAGFGVALLSLLRATQQAPTPRISERAVLLLGGIGLYVAFAAGNNLTFFLGTILQGYATPATQLYAAVFFVLTLLSLYAGLACVRAGLAAPLPQERRRVLLVATALLLPLLWGAIEGALVLETYPGLETVGLWRLAGVGVIAYGLARWRFYDLPQRTANVAATASGTVAAAATGAAAYGAGTLVSNTVAIPAVAGLVVLVAAYLPSLRFARKLFRVQERQPTRAAEEAVYGQRIDAYRAALEASIARGSLDEDQEFLAALRERFNISEAEERVLLHYARTSVVVFRDRKAWDAYERLRLLGEGGGGRTWLARDRSRDRLVVLKEPLERWQQEPAMREAVIREAKLAAKVRHPNVVSVEEVVEGNGSPVIVMEYLEGGSLRDLLRSRGTLPWRDTVTLALDVLHGVEAVHAAGIIHRDLKPSNILLDGQGNPKIADFGIAVPQSSDRTLVDGASTQRAGTYLYMAPEVRSGASMGDRRSDLYSCAVLMRECLYGSPPGAGAPIVVRHDVPQALAELLARGLSERPEDRPASARQLADELARILRA